MAPPWALVARAAALVCLLACASGTPRPPVAAPTTVSSDGLATGPGATRAAAAPVDDPVDRSIPLSSPALDALALSSDQLPADLQVAPGDPACTSLQALTFYSQPSAFGSPRPRARRAEILRRGQRLVGCVLMFDYGAEHLPRARSFLEGLLWGDEGMPSERHPEEVIALGTVLVVLCFDPRDPAGDWYTEHLRRRHRAAVARRCPALHEMQRDLARAGAGTAAEKAPIMKRHQQALLGCSFGAVMVGEVARELEDWPRAEVAFRRAIALDQQGDALTRAGSRFVASYGLALAVSMLGRAEESVGLFEQAVQIASREGNRRFLGWANFNLACALAEAGRWSAAAEALRVAMAVDPSHKARARTDRSFRVARRQPAFKRLLE